MFFGQNILQRSWFFINPNNAQILGGKPKHQVPASPTSKVANEVLSWFNKHIVGGNTICLLKQQRLVGRWLDLTEKIGGKMIGNDDWKMVGNLCFLKNK